MEPTTEVQKTNQELTIHVATAAVAQTNEVAQRHIGPDNWQQSSFVTHELDRLTKQMVDPGTRDESMAELKQLNDAIVSGNSEPLHTYMSTHSQETVDAGLHTVAQAKEKNGPQGQKDAVSIIEADLDQTKTEIAQAAPLADTSSKVELVAGLTYMLEGIVEGDSQKIRRLNDHLLRKATELQQADQQKQHDLGLDTGLSQIQEQLAVSTDATVAISDNGRQEELSASQAQEIQTAITTEDISNLPQVDTTSPISEADLSLAEKARLYLEWKKQQQETRAKLNSALTWTGTIQSPTQ